MGITTTGVDGVAAGKGQTHCLRSEGRAPWFLTDRVVPILANSFVCCTRRFCLFIQRHLTCYLDG